MRRRMRLTEGDLHRLVNESVKKVLTELNWRTYASAADKRREQGRRTYDLERAAGKALSKKHGRKLATFGNEDGRTVYDDEWTNGSNAVGPEIIGSYYTSSPERDWRVDRPTIDDMKRFGDIPYDYDWLDDDEEYEQWKKSEEKLMILLTVGQNM